MTFATVNGGVRRAALNSRIMASRNFCMAANVQVKNEVSISVMDTVPGFSSSSSSDSLPSPHLKTVAGYSLGRTIGSGRFGIVRDICSLPNGQTPRVPLCMKLMSTSAKPKVCSNETNIYSRMMNAAGFDRLFTTPLEMFKNYDPKTNSSTLCLVFERLDGEDLFEMIVSEGCLTEEKTKAIASKLFPAVLHLHNHKIVHRDIKPEHILFRRDANNEIVEDEPILTDFGLSYILGTEDLVSSPAGTFGYASPEVLTTMFASGSKPGPEIWRPNFDCGSREVNALRKKADVWSLGVVLYACISGELPFPSAGGDGTSVADHLEAAYQGPIFDNEYWTDVSPECIDLIKKMLNPDPVQRLSMKQVLKHSWMN